MNPFSNKIRLRVNGKLFGFGSSPEADWKAIFVVTVALIIIGIVVNAYIFIKLDKGEIFLADTPRLEEKNTLNITELNTVLDYYRNKSENLQGILSGTTNPSVVDPSL